MVEASGVASMIMVLAGKCASSLISNRAVVAAASKAVGLVRPWRHATSLPLVVRTTNKAGSNRVVSRFLHRVRVAMSMEEQCLQKYPQGLVSIT